MSTSSLYEYYTRSLHFAFCFFECQLGRQRKLSYWLKPQLSITIVIHLIYPFPKKSHQYMPYSNVWLKLPVMLYYNRFQIKNLVILSSFDISLKSRFTRDGILYQILCWITFLTDNTGVLIMKINVFFILKIKSTQKWKLFLNN